MIKDWMLNTLYIYIYIYICHNLSFQLCKEVQKKPLRYNPIKVVGYILLPVRKACVISSFILCPHKSSSINSVPLPAIQNVLHHEILVVKMLG
jgi:hypothetical protein